MSSVYELWEPFINLFGGIADSQEIGAFGTGAGSWVKRPLQPDDVVRHLQGEGAGIGVPPLRPNNTVKFASIDLDEPDFDAALMMQRFIPGPSWVERSRSGNAHIHCFFFVPIEAWIPMGILAEACDAAGKEHVEVFPKNHDFSRVRFGNYINLPYFGETRPILYTEGGHMDLATFVDRATDFKNDPEEWRKRARYINLQEPQVRESTHEFGTQPHLHMCADYIIEGALSGDRPVTEGHRAAIYYMLSKCLRNWEPLDDDESLGILMAVNETSPDPFPPSEIRRMFRNAAGRTSTGCDDPLIQPFAHPDCPIAHPRST
jgi:hypothetical protein